MCVAGLVGNFVYRRRMQCSLTRLAANSISDLFAVFFVFAFWHPELSDPISRFLPIMLAYMLATDVSMMMWVLPLAQREWKTGVEEACGSAEEDPESQEALRMLSDAIAWLGPPLTIVIAILFLLPAYVLAVMVCLR